MHGCVVDALPDADRDKCSGAVHRRVIERADRDSERATAHLKSLVRHGALDVQVGSRQLERLQEENTVLGQWCAGGTGGGTRKLEVASSREDDAAVHNVVSDKLDHDARSW